MYMTSPGYGQYHDYDIASMCMPDNVSFDNFAKISNSSLER